MSLGLISALTEDESEDDAGIPFRPVEERRPAPKLKGSKNTKAAAVARAGGATTTTERIQGEVIASLKKKERSQQNLNVALKTQDDVRTVMDNVGKMTNEEIFSEEGFQGTQAALASNPDVPQMTKEVYFNKFAPNSVRRRALTAQLAAIPVGTPLPQATLDQLKSAGIDNPSQYMAINVNVKDTSIFGSFKRAAMAQAAAGDKRTPFFTFGKILNQRQARAEQTQAAINEAAESFSKAEFKVESETLTKLQKVPKGEEALTTAQRISNIRGLRKDLNKGLKTISALNEFHNNILDFSDPKKAKRTFRLGENGDIITVTAKRTFQNVRDIGLLFSFIKMLDPDSTVRESEITLTDSATPKAHRMKLLYDQAVAGTLMTEEMRNGILSAANTAMRNAGAPLVDDANSVRDIARRFKLDPDLIVGGKVRALVDKVELLNKGFAEIEGEGVSPTPSAQEGAVAIDLDKFSFGIEPDPVAN